MRDASMGRMSHDLPAAARLIPSAGEGAYCRSVPRCRECAQANRSAHPRYRELRSRVPCTAYHMLLSSQHTDDQ